MGASGYSMRMGGDNITHMSSRGSSREGETSRLNAKLEVILNKRVKLQVPLVVVCNMYMYVL